MYRSDYEEFLPVSIVNPQFHDEAENVRLRYKDDETFVFIRVKDKFDFAIFLSLA